MPRGRKSLKNEQSITVGKLPTEVTGTANLSSCELGSAGVQGSSRRFSLSLREVDQDQPAAQQCKVRPDSVQEFARTSNANDSHAKALFEAELSKRKAEMVEKRRVHMIRMHEQKKSFAMSKILSVVLPEPQETDKKI